MARGRSLSDFEKGQIIAKKAQGLSNRQIARDLGRSHHVLNNFVREPAGYGTRKRSGPSPLLSDRDKRCTHNVMQGNEDIFEAQCLEKYCFACLEEVGVHSPERK